MPAPSRRNRFARVVVAALTATLSSSIVVHPAGAQPDATATIQLVDQPVWHEPEDPLALSLRVANLGADTLAGFRLQVRVYGVARTRSDLHDRFEVDPTSIELGLLDISLDTEIAPGASTVVEIDDPVSALPALATTSEGGVYPLTVTLTDAQGLTSLDSITTQLLYFPSNVETPLNLVLLWPLADFPSRSAGGHFDVDPVAGGTALEAALGERGWLSGITTALGTRAGESLRFGLAPGPRLIDELRDMADGYTRVTDGEPVVVGPNESTSRAAATALDRLRDLLANDNLQAVLAPYALPDLPTLGDLEHANAQLTAAESALDDALGTTVGRGWVFPPGGRLDEPTLEGLRSSDAAASTFLAADSMEPPALDASSTCREDFEGITYTCPVILTTTAGRARGFVLDSELQQRFGSLVNEPGERVGLQRLFAELAMIFFELPGTERVIAVAVPPLWHPPPGVARQFVRTISQGPWLRSRTPRGGLHLGIGAAERALVGDSVPVRGAPDPGYVAEVQEAAEIVESFARMRPPEPLIQRLRRDVLVAESRLWWNDATTLSIGESYATGAREEVERELSKISIGGRRNVTLTSRRGEVPLLLVNDTGYDVSLEVQLVAEGRDIEISENVIRGSFPPGTSPLPFEASARSSGGFRVRVRVQTADGYPVHETFISVRSTEFNEIALGITIGALAFLILFYIFRGARRRRLAHDEAAAE
jgi:Family of unknown function (DUF6049)